jgi:hypothetical protein
MFTFDVHERTRQDAVKAEFWPASEMKGAGRAASKS